MATAFFIASKLIWALLSPGSWIVAGVALAVLGGALGRRRLALWAGLPVLGFLVLLALVPLGEILARPLEGRYPAAPPLQDITGIIVLGGAEWPAYARHGLPQVNAAGERLIETATLARAFPDARVVYTGSYPHAPMARLLLARLGVDPDRIELEQHSRNTVENALFSHAQIDPKPGERWVLITSAQHMPRAMASFARAGWNANDIIPWPTDFRSTRGGWVLVWDLPQNLFQFTHTLKEHVGLLVYGLTGR